MSKTYAEHLTEDRRLVILKLLLQSGGAGNDSVLLAGVRGTGHVTTTRDDVRKDMEFLKDRDLISLEYVHETVRVAKIKERGVDVAEGRTVVEGVKKPSLGGS